MNLQFIADSVSENFAEVANWKIITHLVISLCVMHNASLTNKKIVRRPTYFYTMYM